VLSPIDFEPIRHNIVDELGRHNLVEGRDFVVDLRTRPAGVALLVPELDEKRLGLLHETVPAARRIAVLTTHNTPHDEIRSATSQAGLDLIELSVPGPTSRSFEAMRSAGAQALMIVGTPELVRDAEELASIALRAGLPTICASRVAAERGCLIGYGPNLPKLYQRVGDYVVRTFRGADPGELPIEGPTRIELILNLKTARALGITIPEMPIVQADEAIEPWMLPSHYATSLTPLEGVGMAPTVHALCCICSRQQLIRTHRAGQRTV
jgi:hypothetical protein